MEVNSILLSMTGKTLSLMLSNTFGELLALNGF
jgi:hypothetical protein